MTKIAVTGYKGNIGSRLIKFGYDPLECDVTSETDVSRAISKSKPDLIIHLASKSNVDFCQELKNQELVTQANSRGSANVFKQAAIYGAKVVVVSSDHVFSGVGFGGYRENAKLCPTPKNFYGVSKVHVEAFARAYENVNIIRTSTLFWNRSSIGNVLTNVLNKNDVYIPQFMWRSFLHIDHFVEQIIAYCFYIDNMPKVLNLSGSKVVSWYKFIKDYTAMLGLDDAYVHPKYFEGRNLNYAPRPYHVGLSTKLSASLSIPQYDYLDGIRHEL